jgi:hypothetical protein
LATHAVPLESIALEIPRVFESRERGTRSTKHTSDSLDELRSAMLGGSMVDVDFIVGACALAHARGEGSSSGHAPMGDIDLGFRCSIAIWGSK